MAQPEPGGPTATPTRAPLTAKETVCWRESTQHSTVSPIASLGPNGSHSPAATQKPSPRSATPRTPLEPSACVRICRRELEEENPTQRGYS